MPNVDDLIATLYWKGYTISEVKLYRKWFTIELDALNGADRTVKARTFDGALTQAIELLDEWELEHRKQMVQQFMRNTWDANAPRYLAANQQIVKSLERKIAKKKKPEASP